MDIMGLIIVILVAAVVIWIVGRFGLGIEVSGFGGAIIAAIVIGLVAWVVLWLLSLLNLNFGGPFVGPIITLLVAAVVLLVAGRFVPGLTVKGFGGAIIAAISIAVVYWLVDWVLSLF